MRGKKITVAGLVSAVILAGGAAAYAAVPDAQGVIHACYKNGSPNQGDVRVIDSESGQTCSRNETPLQWNQSGQQGAPGPQGPEGPQGPTGPATPTDAWFATGSTDGTIFSALVRTLVSEELPAGDFLVFASVTATLSGDDGSAICWLMLNGITLDKHSFDFSDGEVEHAAATLMTDATGPLTVDVVCLGMQDDPGGPFIFGEIKVRLAATKTTPH